MERRWSQLLSTRKLLTLLLELTWAVNVSLLHISENTESFVWFKLWDDGGLKGMKPSAVGKVEKALFRNGSNCWISFTRPSSVHTRQNKAGYYAAAPKSITKVRLSNSMQNRYMILLLHFDQQNPSYPNSRSNSDLKLFISERLCRLHLLAIGFNTIII